MKERQNNEEKNEREEKGRDITERKQEKERMRKRMK